MGVVVAPLIALQQLEIQVFLVVRVAVVQHHTQVSLLVRQAKEHQAKEMLAEHRLVHQRNHIPPVVVVVQEQLEEV